MSCNAHDKASAEEIERLNRKKDYNKRDLQLDPNDTNPPRKKSDWLPTYHPESWNRSSK